MQKISFLLVLLAFPFLNQAQGVKTISFRQEKLKTRLQNYYIAGVKDDRQDTATIGSVRAGVFSKKYVSLNLPGGAAAAISNFLKANLTQDTRTNPITLHIVQLEVAEKTGGLKAESEVRMSIAFYNAGGKIVEYKGNNTVQSAMDATRYIEELIRRGLDDMLQQFDTWAGQNQQQLKASNSGPSIEVQAEVVASSDDTDRIAWSAGRPLTLDDFKGRPDDLSRAAAATNSGLDVRTSQHTQFSQTRVVVTILPFFDRSRSWCRTNSRNARTLQHEQQHFNITAIKACELADTIRNFTFTPGNFMKELEQLYRQKEKEIQQQQELYDSETNHGQVAAAQTKWEQMIRDMLGRQGCYR
ncbi:MAG TPA: DUF922 domain-containing protein [Puia sp.]|jgi:hypothetical protein|nr:DUF922 domain-containing protein [Puia sp.]